MDVLTHHEINITPIVMKAIKYFWLIVNMADLLILFY